MPDGSQQRKACRRGSTASLQKHHGSEVPTSAGHSSRYARRCQLSRIPFYKMAERKYQSGNLIWRVLGVGKHHWAEVTVGAQHPWKKKNYRTTEVMYQKATVEEQRQSLQKPNKLLLHPWSTSLLLSCQEKGDRKHWAAQQPPPEGPHTPSRGWLASHCFHPLGKAVWSKHFCTVLHLHYNWQRASRVWLRVARFWLSYCVSAELNSSISICRAGGNLHALMSS